MVNCLDLAVVILVAVLSDTQDSYQFRVGIGMLEAKEDQALSL